MLVHAALLLSFAEPPDAVTSATELHRTVNACEELLGPEKPVSKRISGEDAVLCIRLPNKELELVRVSGGVTPPGSAFEVKLVRRNGANSDYAVTRPAGAAVYGILTNVTSVKVKVGTRRVKIKGIWRHVPTFENRAIATIYAPYSEAVREPVAIEYGKAYLDGAIEKTRERLDELGITSRLDADKPLSERHLMTEVVSKRHVTPLDLIEHIDPDWMTEFGTQHSLDRVFTTIGLNGDGAYAFAGSSAKANGIVQMIQPTYRDVLRDCPEMHLDPDYLRGMRDHLNAMMAQFCLIDTILSKLPDEQRERLMDGAHEEDLVAFIAAAYNGGAKWAVPAYVHDPAHWDQHPEIKVPNRIKGKKRRNAWYRKELARKHLIPDQTVVYVHEARLVYRNLYVPGASL